MQLLRSGPTPSAYLKSRTPIEPRPTFATRWIEAVVSASHGWPSSIYWQHRRGGGTPFPLLPTKRSLTYGPHRFPRNPLALFP